MNSRNRQEQRKWTTNKIIERLTQEIEELTKSPWISVNNEEPKDESCLYWVFFPNGAVIVCRLNDYKSFGGKVNYWQTLNHDDLLMHETWYCKIKQPEPPQL